jgi:hypothetical protein
MQRSAPLIGIFFDLRFFMASEFVMPSLEDVCFAVMLFVSGLLLLYSAVIVPFQICMWDYSDPCNTFPTLNLDMCVDTFFLVISYPRFHISRVMFRSSQSSLEISDVCSLRSFVSSSWHRTITTASTSITSES